MCIYIYYIEKVKDQFIYNTVSLVLDVSAN
jgi:hypothetical protein